MTRTTVGIITLLTAMAPMQANASVTYVEAIDGERSDNRFAPTFLTLGAGANTVTGTFGISATPDMPDVDYITITVPEGFVLDEFQELGANVGGAFSFVGIEAGSMISIPWDGSSVESPLTAGTYSLRTLELNTSREYPYSFGMQLAAVPAPGALAILSCALTIGIRWRRRARLFVFHHAIPTDIGEHISQR